MPAYPPPTTTTSASLGRSRPERSGRAGIVALHNERSSKSLFRAVVGIAEAYRVCAAIDTCRMCATVVA